MRTLFEMGQTRKEEVMNQKPQVTTRVVHSGVGFFGLLMLLLLALKITGYIDSWWWVLSPLWIPVVLLCALGLVILLVIVVLSLRS
jgi:ABC-type polysaccharide/polyol phosphate export permease